VTRASDILDDTEKQFSSFGPSKRAELARLLYEITRRDQIPASLALADCRPGHLRDFAQVKAHLLKRRFPSLTNEDLAHIPPLTAVPASFEHRVSGRPWENPFQQVFYEHTAAQSLLLKRLREQLPDIPFEEISSYKDYCRTHPFSLTDYNRRRETLFLVQERYDFFLPCPCSAPSLPCGYHILNAGMGCGFDCEYCYLQGYVNAPGLVLPANLDDILARFPEYYRPGMRLGTGQFTDSLFLDSLTGFSKTIISYFKKFPDVLFEFKTKSDDIAGILAEPVPGNILVSWSLNPQKIADAVEHGTPSLIRRLEAARQCAAAGYLIGFHFDPVVFYPGWEDDYQDVVKKIFAAVSPERIAWISLGCLRMTPGARAIMEQRFPESPLLNAEQIIGYDGKIRYPERVRRGIYTVIRDCIRRDAPRVPVYLCMEDPRLCRELCILPDNLTRH